MLLKRTFPPLVGHFFSYLFNPKDGVATVVHLRVPPTACDQLPPLRALRAFVRSHYLPSRPVVMIYAYHPSCPAEDGAAYFDQMFNFKWQLNTSTTPLGYKLTSNAKHRGDNNDGGGSAPVFESGGEIYSDQDRLLCGMVILLFYHSRPLLDLEHLHQHFVW